MPNMNEQSTESSIERVVVELGDRRYDILIGRDIIARAGEEIADRMPGARALIVTDRTVGALYLGPLASALRDAGIDHAEILLPPGEKTKSFDHLREVVGAILDARLERGDIVIALGGGVIGDLAGFAAGIARRGMHFVQVPTSLMAQVDSSVGGKTGINAPQGKNLIGVFHQPRLVLADTVSLDTLPPREMRAGYAEVVKYGLINRPEFFSWLERNWRDIFSGGASRTAAIAESCRAKAAVVARDEREAGDRALLNLGHTFGHALEAATGYDSDRLVHGEGVAIGMVLAYRFSVRLGLADRSDADRVEAHLRAVGLPAGLGDISGERPDADTLMHYIAQDKKVSRGNLTLVLARGIGRSFIARDVPAADLLSFLREHQPA